MRRALDQDGGGRGRQVLQHSHRMPGVDSAVNKDNILDIGGETAISAQIAFILQHLHYNVILTQCW